MATKKTTQENAATTEGRVRLSASLIQQAGKQFYSVTMPTDLLASCCYVTSREEDRNAGFQRVLDRKRAEDIANYIDSGLGTIPGSIILSAQEDASLKLIGGSKTVEFTPADKAFLVLDGQHRVYGFSLSQTALRVPVVIYSGLTPTEEARLFIDINTKQRQVPNELLLDIKKLAQREDDKSALLRETFDLFHSESSSALIGLMSPSTRQSNRISRVTFNLAFKSPMSIFREDPTPQKVFLTTNAYLSAFVSVLEELGLEGEITRPTVFRAIMELFPEVARISAAQHGKTFSKARFTSVLNPISQTLTAAKFERATSSVRDLSNLLSTLIKKDFSI
jgi:DGQHR domain-containing protein